MTSSFAALVRKERLFFVGFAILLLSASVLPLHSNLTTRFALDASLEELGLALCSVALLGGAWLGLREEVTRTQEFLRHRPLVPDQPVLARALPGVALVLLAPTVAGALVYLYDLAFGGGGFGVQSGAWLSLVALGAAGGATFAASFLCGSAPLSWLARAFGLFLLLVAQLVLQSWLGSVLPLTLWTLALLAWSGALLFTACAVARRPRDLERPPPREFMGAPLAVLTGAALLFGALATAGWQKLASRELAETRPWIGWTPDGRLVRCKWVGKPGSFAIVDEAGQATGEELDDDQPRVFTARYTLHGIKLFPEPRLRSIRIPPNGGHERRLLVDEASASWIESDLYSEERRRVELLGAGELGDPRALQQFETGAVDEYFFLFVPGQTLWRVRDDGTPRLERVELPGGARPLETTRYFGSEEWWKRGRALDTTDGAFLFENESWVRPPSELYRQPRLASEAVDPDPFTPLQRVTGPEGVTLEVRHPLDSAGKKALAGWMGLSSVLRPLPLALVSALLDYERVAAERADEFLVLFDPVLGGGYAWLLVPNVLLHVWLAWALSNEFARRGMEPARRRRWALACLVAGIWIAAWCAALETRRAWRKSRSGPSPAPLVYAPRGATA